MLSPRLMPQKTYDELMNENIGKIPIYTDEWTNYNPSDPGIAILENLSGAQIIQQNAMDEPNEGVRAKLLKLLGYTPAKGKGARVYIEPHGVAERFTILADQKFRVGDMCYETNRQIEIPDSHITGIYGCIDGEYKDFSYLIDNSIIIPTEILGKVPGKGTQIYFVFDKPLKPGEQGIIHMEVSDNDRRNPFDESQKNLFADFKWECFCDEGFVPMEVDDGTNNFLVDGEIIFTQPKQTAAVYEDGNIKGYVWRAEVEASSYDTAPSVRHISGFLFQVIQKDTLAITHSFQKSTDIYMQCNMLEDGYIGVFAKEQKGSSYRKYEEYNQITYGNNAKGRFYRKIEAGYGRARFEFDKETFGYEPANIKNPVKIVIYNEEMMKKYYLGDVYGYDNQEIHLPVKHVVTETFCIIARRPDGEGGFIYDFLKPNKLDEKKMSYYLYENEGKIVILDAGDYVGASLYLGSLAVMNGEDGNIRKGNTFYSNDIRTAISFTNPANGEGGRFSESLEQVRRRFINDMNTPNTAVTAQDYISLANMIPGLCIAKANAWRDDDRNEVQIAIMPDLEQDFPKLSDVYINIIEKYFDDKRLLSTAVRILQPMYVPVNVTGRIYVKMNYNDCSRTIEEAIKKELDYMHSNRQFGEPLRFDRVFHAIEALECVSYINELRTDAAGNNVRTEGADIYPNNNCLFYPGHIRIETIVAEEV